MKKYSKHKINTKALVIILSFFCCCLIVLSLVFTPFRTGVQRAVNSFLTPMQSGINSVGTWFVNKSQYKKDLTAAQNENKKLQKKINELTEENVLLASNKYELERLRALYNLDETYSKYKKKAAHVIAKDNSSNWFASFTIDKGSADGIKTDMNVIADNGLVGIVTETGSHYAKVKSIIDDGYNVSGKMASSSDLCIVEGDLELANKGLLKISNISDDSVVKEGDMIMTSHISNKYLPGILIGYVSEIKTDANGLTKSGYLMSAVDFKHLEEVFVITQLKETK